MSGFEPGRAITTREPTLPVPGGLPVGVYRIQLVVIDEMGNASAPAVHTVSVVRFFPGPGPLPGPLTDPVIILRSGLV
jgi:hypothetical protein